jgi:hypothetical protein
MAGGADQAGAWGSPGHGFLGLRGLASPHSYLQVRQIRRRSRYSPLRTISTRTDRTLSQRGHRISLTAIEFRGAS